jgi:hypothetical protein
MQCLALRTRRKERPETFFLKASDLYGPRFLLDIMYEIGWDNCRHGRIRGLASEQALDKVEKSEYTQTARV